MNGRRWAASHLAGVAMALLVLLAHTQVGPVAAQEAGHPSRCDNWQLTGRWSAATTEAGRNRSLVNTTLHLVQRGSLLVGRWTPLEGREVVVEGSIAAGIARLTFIKPDAPRHLVLAVASDARGSAGAGRNRVPMAGSSGRGARPSARKRRPHRRRPRRDRPMPPAWSGT